jgi:hypothetical protein
MELSVDDRLIHTEVPTVRTIIRIGLSIVLLVATHATARAQAAPPAAPAAPTPVSSPDAAARQALDATVRRMMEIMRLGQDVMAARVRPDPVRLRKAVVSCDGPVSDPHTLPGALIPMYPLTGEPNPVFEIAYTPALSCPNTESASGRWNQFPDVVIVNIERHARVQAPPQMNAELFGDCNKLKAERECREVQAGRFAPFSRSVLMGFDTNKDNRVELLVLAKTGGTTIDADRQEFAEQRAIALFTVALAEPERFTQFFPEPTLQGTPAATACPPLLTGRDRQYIDVLLDRTGIASSQFLNPRAPMYAGPPPECLLIWTESDIQQYLRGRHLRFLSRTADRSFTVTFSGINEVDRAEYLRLGVRLGSCKTTGCTATLHVGEHSSASIPLSLLWISFIKQASSLIAFDVGFFEEETAPTNARGYFTMALREVYREPANSQTWSANVGATVAHDPDLNDLVPADNRPAVIRIPFEKEAGAPRDSENRSRVTGNVVLGLAQTLGARADGEFEVQLKEGDFGRDATVTATKYRLRVYAANGFWFSGGKFDVASPSFGIAMRERGEAITAHHPIANAMAALIIRKELPRDRLLADIPKDPLDRDHWAIFGQAVPAVRLRRKAAQWGQLNFFGVYGRQQRQRTEKAGTDEATVRKFNREYTTVGSEFLATVRQMAFSGAFFSSRTTAESPDAVSLAGDRGRGHVGLLTLTYTDMGSGTANNRQNVDATLSGFFGFGSGDRIPSEPTKKDDNEGYIGETGNFAPDQIFLSRLAGLINTDVRARDGSNAIVTTRNGQVGQGLANKLYVGAFYTDQRWSLLAPVAGLLNIPASDIESRSTTVKFHIYRFREPVFGDKDGGRELDVDFKLESPKGVKYTLAVARFWPGDALKRSGLIAPKQWLVSLGLSVKL